VLRSLSFRLAVLYSAIFAVSSVAGLSVAYFIMSSYLMRDVEAGIALEFDELAAVMRQGNPLALAKSLEHEVAEEGPDVLIYRCYAKDRSLQWETDASAWPGLALTGKSFAEAAAGRRAFETQRLGQEAGRARVLVGAVRSDDLLLVAWALREHDRVLAKIRDACVVATVCMMMVGTLAGWLLGKRAMAGVEEVTVTVAGIAAGDFSRRVAAKPRGEEIDRLAATFNAMAERIQSLMKEMREINDNIAHDLRSPIARMRGMAELVLAAESSIEECHAMAESVVEECDTLLGMINTMLDISEVEAGVGSMRIADVDLAEVVRNGLDLFLPVADEKGVSLSLGSLPEALHVRGDARRLQRMMATLLDNAVKYTPAGGKVVVSVSADGGLAKSMVKDTGGGISRKHLPHIFERFYRGDASRSQPGSGLGLSLARAIARAHGGDIIVESEPGKGSTFMVTISVDPSVPPARAGTPTTNR